MSKLLSNRVRNSTGHRGRRRDDSEGKVIVGPGRTVVRPNGRTITIEPILYDPELERLKKLQAAGKLKTVPMDEDFAAEYNARRLRWRAEELGLTQREIARRVGVSPVVINRIFKNPDRSTVATLRKIAKAMGVKLVELLDG